MRVLKALINVTLTGVLYNVLIRTVNNEMLQTEHSNESLILI